MTADLELGEPGVDPASDPGGRAIAGEAERQSTAERRPGERQPRSPRGEPVDPASAAALDIL